MMGTTPSTPRHDTPLALTCVRRAPSPSWASRKRATCSLKAEPQPCMTSLKPHTAGLRLFLFYLPCAVCSVLSPVLTLCDSVDWPIRLLCPWYSQAKLLGVTISPSQWIFPDPGTEPTSPLHREGRFSPLCHEGEESRSQETGGQVPGQRPGGCICCYFYPLIRETQDPGSNLSVPEGEQLFRFFPLK